MDRSDNEECFLRRSEVEALTTLSKVCIYRRIKEGTFPRPVNLGGRRVAWRRSDVRRWMEDRPAAGGV